MNIFMIKRRKTSLTLGAVLGTFLVTICSVAFAVGIDLTHVKPLSPIDWMPKEKFNELTQLIEEVPFGDKSLAYSIRIPKAWEINTRPFEKKLEATGKPNNRVLGIVSSYIGPPKEHQRSYFTLEAVSIDYEVGVRDWFINFMVSEGKSLEGISEEKDNKIEAIYVEVEADTTYIVRVSAIINGPRVIIARYYTTQKLFTEEKVMQAQVIHSFKLKNIESQGIERLETFGFLGQSYFDYPVSWSMKADTVKTIDRMKARLQRSKKEGLLDGRINIYLSNKEVTESRKHALAFYRDKFAVDNYAIERLIEKVKFEYHEDMTYGSTEAYQMVPTIPQMINFEFWVSIIEGEDYYYVLTLLTPARSEDFYEWARNVRAFRIVVKNMRRDDDGDNFYEFIR